VTEEPENTPPWASGVFEELPPGLRRRKNTKGYCISSEEERSGESGCYLSEGETEETKVRGPWEPSISSDEYPTTPPLDSLEIRTYTHVPSTVSVILPSLLPLTYVTDNVSVASGASFASNAFDTLTYHRELREAQMGFRLRTDHRQTGIRVVLYWCISKPGISPFKTLKLTSHPSSFLLPRKYIPLVCFDP
jgi:hypothetical protein